MVPVASQLEQVGRTHLRSFWALQRLGPAADRQARSDGQESCVVQAALTIDRPHLLLLDEPTNKTSISTPSAR